MTANITRSVLIQRLQELRQEVGRSPTVEDLRNAEGYPSLSEYIGEFGWWNEAKKAAGLSVYQGGEGGSSRPGPEPGYNREELLDKLRELEERVDGQASKEDMAEAEGFSSPSTYRRRFGSWNEVRRKAGLQPISKEQYGDEELIGFLQAKAGQIGERPLRRKDIADDKSLPHPSIYNERFGSFRQAKQEAGVR